MFKIINPSHAKKEQGRKKYGRQLDWGFADSHSHSDFNSLHKLVLKYIRVDLVKTMKMKHNIWQRRQQEIEAE